MQQRDDDDEIALVTGASGLLGSHLVPHLLARGNRLRLLCRQPPRSDWAHHPRITVVPGDLTDPASLARAVVGVGAVYNLAANTRKWLPDRRVHRAVNVDGALTLARRATDAGAGKIVHVSSFTVHGPSNAGKPRDETDQPAIAALQNDYQRSKAAAHRDLLALARDGAPVVIACPGVLYGPSEAGAPNPIAELITRALTRRFIVLPGGAARLWTLAFLPDVAAALHAMRRVCTPGEELLLGGPTTSLRAIARWLVAVSGRGRHTVTLPLPLLLAAGTMSQWLAACLRQSPRFTAAALRFLTTDWEFASQRAASRIDYRPTPLPDALLLTWRDLHGRRLVPHPAPEPDVVAAIPAP